MGSYVIKMSKEFKHHNKFVGKLSKGGKKRKFVKFV